jgi:hypothetical protein
MKKSTPHDPSGPPAEEVSASRTFDEIPQAEIVTDFEEDGEELERADSAYFTIVDEETAPRSSGVKPPVAGSRSPLSRGRERGSSFTPDPSGPDREVRESAPSAAPYYSVGSDASPEEIPFGPPPVLVLAGAAVLLLLLLALWR